jgi:4-amino-4-deoxy-L-arabinose transferase-like glycosyltransferase
MSFLRSAFPFAAIVLMMALGLRIDVMDIDAAQYASISAEIVRTGNWLSPTNDHEPYLDKPPLHFWLSALSMTVFGMGNIGYKFPALIMALLALYATYRLCALMGDRAVARNAALILGSMVALMLLTNDVRTDTALLGCTTVAVWLWAEALHSAHWRHVAAAAIFTALAMLAKGPIGAVFPVMALGPYIAMHRKSVKPRLWMLPLTLLIVAVMLTPMCIGLWRDHGPEGLRFYFWTQSFGRITGENRWQNDSSFFYLSHALLWATAPWTIVILKGLWRHVLAIPSLVRQPSSVIIPVSAVLLGYTSLSLSHYKLPHYVFIILPYLAIMAAQELEQRRNWHRWALGIEIVAMLIIAWGLCLWAFPTDGFPVILALSGAAVLAVLLLHGRLRLSLSESGALLAGSAYLCLNLHLYPALLGYQANSQIGRWASENRIDHESLVCFATGGHALNFYAGETVRWYSSIVAVAPAITPGTYVIADSLRAAELLNAGLIPKERIRFSSFRVQLLTWKFIDPRTRAQAIRPCYVLRY